ncbi:hypothetical protein A2U01_0105398 [Trifolium medium]|uniref:Uncharacterized protein n=1 Tax=Trifolium medium TaxID=97028 RepID=A0A392V9K2_9FABA|nr:hypothetical protein [Trifolium medium]
MRLAQEAAAKVLAEAGIAPSAAGSFRILFSDFL